jgi:hypothetical protein
MVQSLGGAVASLCTLRLLQKSQEDGLPPPPVTCITFGTPAIGNSALASRVNQNGWKDRFHNVVLPGAPPPFSQLNLKKIKEQVDDRSLPFFFAVSTTNVVGHMVV